MVDPNQSLAAQKALCDMKARSSVNSLKLWSSSNCHTTRNWKQTSQRSNTQGLDAFTNYLTYTLLEHRHMMNGIHKDIKRDYVWQEAKLHHEAVDFLTFILTYLVIKKISSYWKMQHHQSETWPSFKRLRKPSGTFFGVTAPDCSSARVILGLTRVLNRATGNQPASVCWAYWAV